MRPRLFAGVVGQTISKNIMKTNLKDKTFPNFSAVVGDTGYGKSTLAEICALSLTCERGAVEPCLECPTCIENLQALTSTARSNTIVKINSALLDDKKDVTAMIKEIFVLESISGSNIVYIIEEFQELSDDKQAKLLEEVSRISPGVYIIICSSKEYKIIRAIRSRAFIFRLTAPNREECFLLIDNLTRYLDMPKISSDLKYVITRKTAYTPREIDKIIAVLKNCDDFEQTVLDYLQVVHNTVYIRFLAECFEPMQVFVKYMNGLKDVGMSYVNLYEGLEDFMLDVFAYRFAEEKTIFSRDEKVIIDKIFNELDIESLGYLVETVSSKKPNGEHDAYFKLVSLKNLVVKSELKEIEKHSYSNAVQATLNSERILDNRQNEKASAALKPISEETALISKTNIVHENKWNLPS